jgi:hypothetical protein
LYEAKAQVGELGTDEKGDPKWGDWKICLVRLKREVKEEGQDDSQPMRRMLMRVDPSGHIAHVSIDVTTSDGSIADISFTYRTSL